jgi:hypothetical protein
MSTSKWREQFRVHPAADVFPMMDVDGLMKLAHDIRINGLREPVKFRGDELLEGRNRLEAAERVGYKLTAADIEQLPNVDPVAYVMSANIHRRHMTKAQIADAIVALAKIGAEQKPGQAGLVSDDEEMVELLHLCGDPTGLRIKRSAIDKMSKGGRGKINKVRAKAVEINAALPKEDQVSERTIKRAFAKAEGRIPKKPINRKPKLETRTGIEAAREYYFSELRRLDDDQWRQESRYVADQLLRLGRGRKRPRNATAAKLEKVFALFYSTDFDGERQSAIAAACRMLQPSGVKVVADTEVAA